MKAFAALAVTVVASIGGMAAQEVPLDGLSWMAGRWIGTSNGTESEEVWMSPGGGAMVAMHRDVFASGRYFFEHLRIEVQEGEIVFLASPGGRQPPTPFRLAEQGDRYVRFENLAHDFPQKIAYRREGDVLHVTAEGTEGGKEVRMAWAWRRTPFPAMLRR